MGFTNIFYVHVSEYNRPNSFISKKCQERKTNPFSQVKRSWSKYWFCLFFLCWNAGEGIWTLEVKSPVVFETTALGRAWLPQQEIKAVKSLIKDFFISLSIQVEIKAKISRTKETRKINVETGSTVEYLLKKIKLKPDTLIVMSNNEPIPVDDVLNEGQELTIIQVASGG